MIFICITSLLHLLITLNNSVLSAIHYEDRQDMYVHGLLWGISGAADVSSQQVCVPS